MLQQTQVSRVVPYYERWLGDFPTLEALAAAPLEAVLEHWQGLGYNRRAVALKRLAEEVVAAHDAAGGRGPAALPSDEKALRALPGVGPATAAGVLAFGFERPAAYLETNVRAVVLHELFADADTVPDSAVMPVVVAAAAHVDAIGVGARPWNYALLDYGAHLKRTVPNPSRRSAHHGRQSAFEGSRRQKRARLLRAVMAAPGGTVTDYSDSAGDDERLAAELLGELAGEGFLVCDSGHWY
ncbi:MAG: adenine glycosylase, partial [Actinobacteria bacterium]